MSLEVRLARDSFPIDVGGWFANMKSYCCDESNVQLYCSKASITQWLWLLKLFLSQENIKNLMLQRGTLWGGAQLSKLKGYENSRT
jgi:hypothetical protein